MADVKIPELPPLTSIAGTAMLVVDTGIQTYRINAQDLAHSLESLMNERVTQRVKGGGSFTIPAGTTAIRVSAYKRPEPVMLKPTGEAFNVGNNFFGDIGDNTSGIDRSSPVAVFGGHSFEFYNQLHGGYGLKADGSAWCWGANTNGQLGDGTILAKSIPTLVIGGHAFQKITVAFPNNQFKAGLRTDGRIFSWGPNGSGEIGDNSIASRSSPTALIGGHYFSDVAYSGLGVVVALKPDGSAWAWGTSFNGAIGDNTNAGRSSPVAIVGGHKFVKVLIVEEQVVALKSNGSVWSWGYNGNGQIGDGTTLNRSSPVAVIGGHTFVDIAITGYSTHGLKADGSIWSWGAASYLGHGLTAVNANSRSSPVAVIGGHVFDKIVGIWQMNVFGIKADGSVWGWGSNPNGQLGDGTTADRSSPVAVIGGHFFENVITGENGNYVRFIKRDGSIWAAGYGNVGQLADGGPSQYRSSPVAAIGGHLFGKLPAAATRTQTITVSPTDVLPYSVHEGIFGPVNFGRGLDAFDIEYWISR